MLLRRQTARASADGAIAEPSLGLAFERPPEHRTLDNGPLDKRTLDDRTLDNHSRLHAMFHAHHNLVWRTLRRYGLDADGAADVAQQAYLVAIERVADIWPGSERAFLMGTALRIARSAGRKAARLLVEDRLEDRLEHPLRQVGHPESHASTLELLDLALSQLEPSLIEVFVLFDVEGFSAPEIAEALGIPTGTVASRVRRAREEFRGVTQRLQRAFEREGGGQ